MKRGSEEDIFAGAGVETCTKRRPWNPDEDEQLRHLVEIHGVKNWALIATQLNMRNGKQCRERWRNHLRPELNKGDWDTQEDVDIWDRVQQMGTKWAQISETYMPSRTDNDIKNRWNSIIRKQQHPSGRPWRAWENAAREQILGNTRCQQRRPASEKSERSGRKLAHVGSDALQLAELDDIDDMEDEEADLLRAAAEGESPIRLRKLFDSPEQEGEGAAGAAQQTLKKEGGSSSADALATPGPAAGPPASNLANLLGGEISAETFDADAYLLEAVGFSPDSKCCSPVSAPRCLGDPPFDVL